MISSENKFDLKLKERYSCFIYSPSWELERRRKTIVRLDEQVAKTEEELTNSLKNRILRLQSIERNVDLFDNIFPIVEDCYKITEKKRGQIKCKVICEEERIVQTRKEVNRLKKQLNCLVQIRQKLIARLQNFTKFKHYLNAVCSESEGRFQTISQLLERFNSLLVTRHSLILSSEKAIAGIKEHRQNFASLILEKQKEDVEHQNKIIELKRKQNQLQAELECLEEKLANLKSTAAKRILESAQLKMSIYNLCSQTRDMLGRSLEINSSDVGEQVRFIQDALKQVDEVRMDVRNVLAPSSLDVELEHKFSQMKKQQECSGSLSDPEKIIQPKNPAGLQFPAICRP